MPSECKSDVLLSPFPDALMLRHLLHWNSQSIIKANAESGAQVQGGGLILPEDRGRGVGAAISWGPQNFMTLGPDCTDSSLFQKQCRGGYKLRYTTKLLERGYCKLVFTTRRSVSVYTEKITSQDSIMMTSVLWLTVPVWWTLILSGTSAQGTAKLMKVKHCLFP